MTRSTLPSLFGIIVLTSALQGQTTSTSVTKIPCTSAHWTDITPAPGLARQSVMMAYDSDRQVVVMFGGYNPSTSYFCGDTYEWDGTSWTLRSTQGPSPRGRGAMVYDKTLRKCILVGGSDLNYASGIYAWDGATWTPLPEPPSPDGVAPLLPRVDFAMVYDEMRSEIVVFGGYSPNGTLGDTWVCRGGTWERRSVAGPPARSRHGMVYDPAAGRTVLFGGLSANAGNLGDTWEWEGQAWTETTGDIAPSARSMHAMAYDPASQRVMVYAGAGTASNDTWVYGNPIHCLQNGDCGPPFWQKLDDNARAPRVGGVAVGDPARGNVVLFGGSHKSGSCSNETWIWSDAKWSLADVSVPYAATFATDFERGEIVGFGGLRGDKFSGDTWAFDGARFSLLAAAASPSPRSGASLAFDSDRRTMLLFGGYDGAYRQDTWEWNGVTWAQRSTTGPTPRAAGRLTYDAPRQEMVMFGGNNTSALRDTWVWDGVNWRLGATTGPFASTGAVFYNPTFQHVAAIDSTQWRWDGTQWVADEAMPIAPMGAGAILWGLTWDPDRRTAVGGNTGLLLELWAGRAWRQVPANAVGASSQYLWTAYCPVRRQIVCGAADGHLYALDRPDTDCDGVNDVADNCDYAPNASQADADGNGVGDACQMPAVLRWKAYRPLTFKGQQGVIILKDNTLPSPQPIVIEPRSGNLTVGVDFATPPPLGLAWSIRFTKPTPRNVYSCTTGLGSLWGPNTCAPIRKIGTHTEYVLSDTCGTLEIYCEDEVLFTSDPTCPFIALLGDVTGDGVVSLGDAIAIRQRVGTGEARYDIDGRIGISLGDVLLAKSRIGQRANCP